MSGLSPSGEGAQSPTTPTFQSSFFHPTRTVYPPEPGRPNPDDLIRDIPFPESAFSAFHSVPFAQASNMGSENA